MDEREQDVRKVVGEPREWFEKPPAPGSLRVLFNEYDKAEVLDSEGGMNGEEDAEDEEERKEEEEEEAKLTKPRKPNKLKMILPKSGGDMAVVEVYNGTARPPEVEKPVENEAEEGVTKEPVKSEKKPNKSQTEVQKLGGPVQDKPKSRGQSRVKARDTDCWCTSWESLGRPAIRKAGK